MGAEGKGTVRTLRVGLSSLAASSALLALALSLYAALNRSGHTGWEPLMTLVLFVPTALAGAISLLFARRLGPIVRPATLALATGVAGITLVVWLDQTHRLVEYQRWIERGMPSVSSVPTRP
jgi:hypothetical protein